MMEGALGLDETDIIDDNRAYDDRALDEDLHVLKELEREQDKRRDSLARKRAGRQMRRQSGTSKSPFFDDDD